MLMLPPFTTGAIALFLERHDVRGQGVACGGSFISPRKKCSKGKSATTPKEALAKTKANAKAKHALKKQVAEDKGKKAAVIEKKALRKAPKSTEKPKKTRKEKPEQFSGGGVIRSREVFESEIANIFSQIDKEFSHGGLVPIYKVRRALGDRVSRKEFNDWMMEMQADDKFQLIGGEMPSLTPDKAEDSINTKLGGARYYMKRLPGADSIKKVTPVAGGKTAKKEAQTKGKPLKSYDDFKQGAMEKIKELDDESGGENLVPIYELRRQLGDRVSRSEFNDWMLEMQANDEIQLVGGEMPSLTPDKAEDSISTKLGGARYYVKRLKKNKDSVDPLRGWLEKRDRRPHSFTPLFKRRSA